MINEDDVVSLGSVKSSKNKGGIDAGTASPGAED